MNEKRLKKIIRQLEEEKEIIYPYLELTLEEIDYLGKRGVEVLGVVVELPHFLIEGVYQRTCLKLKLKGSEE